MQIIEQSWSFESIPNGEAIIRSVEKAGRTCYKSEDKITEQSVLGFVTRVIKSGHHSVLEHASISVRIITDRGVSHEIVRHRLAAYSQESTRYCNYGKSTAGITVIMPVWFSSMSWEDRDSSVTYCTWADAMIEAESAYFDLLSNGQSPQEARTVLPNSLKTELVMTCNIREWRHFFTLRCSPAAHPQMRELARSMLSGFKKAVPIVFDDVWEGH